MTLAKKRKNLLEQLAKVYGDEERDHLEAEQKLLEWLLAFDPEIAHAWLKAKDVQQWWYA